MCNTGVGWGNIQIVQNRALLYNTMHENDKKNVQKCVLCNVLEVTVYKKLGKSWRCVIGGGKEHNIAAELGNTCAGAQGSTDHCSRSCANN